MSFDKSSSYRLQTIIMYNACLVHILWINEAKLQRIQGFVVSTDPRRKQWQEIRLDQNVKITRKIVI